MHRGCASDRTDDKDTCNALDKKCGLCHANHRLGCNNEATFRDPIIACQHCKNTEICAWGQTDGNNVISCSKVVFFPDKESCYTAVDANGNVTRGCSLDDNVCSQNSCQKCYTGGGCNDRNVRGQSCLVCRSSEFLQTCADENPPNYYEVKCNTKPMYHYNERGCYTKRDGKFVQRGCTMDLSPSEAQECIDHENKCSFCNSGDYCNTGPAPGAANTVKVLPVISFIILVAFLKAI